MTWLPMAPAIAPCVKPFLDRATADIVSGISAPRATKVAPEIKFRQEGYSLCVKCIHSYMLVYLHVYIYE